ncbi:hypothetical protein Angca_008720, partial [Angiostrongylus cantonensis]
ESIVLIFVRNKRILESYSYQHLIVVFKASISVRSRLLSCRFISPFSVSTERSATNGKLASRKHAAFCFLGRMVAELINGVEISKLVLSEVAKKLTLTKSENPGFNVVLAIVQVGNRPDSNVYIGAKNKKAKEIGAEGRLIKLPDTTTQSELEAEICKLNVDDDIDGIIVQV